MKAASAMPVTPPTEKKTIDWEARRREFLSLIEPYRSRDGRYDCVVPWSGGKDSSSIAWRLKFEFGLNPLLVTFSPLVLNEVGEHNRQAMIAARLRRSDGPAESEGLHVISPVVFRRARQSESALGRRSQYRARSRWRSITRSRSCSMPSMARANMAGGSCRKSIARLGISPR